jgi:hypothetical protein
LVDLRIEERDVQAAVDEFNESIPEKLPPIIENVSKLILKELKQDCSRMLKEHQKIRRDFERGLFTRWGEALNSLEMLIVMCTETGEAFNAEFRAAACREQDCEFEALTRLHARSCQIANEVLTLLKGGYADGAHARWRTLHEISVVSNFIRKHGKDVAERYLLHEGIESQRAAEQYQQHCVKLGQKPYSAKELNQIAGVYEALIKRFGPDYRKEYGWAVEALGRKDPKFCDIEGDVELGHWRPYYKLASHNIHANPKAIRFRLGLYRQNKILLAGPSDCGLTDPGHGTAISLSQVTFCLLTLKPNIDRLATCYMVHSVVQEVGCAFRAKPDSFPA